jgi:hypothetical protein
MKKEVTFGYNKEGMENIKEKQNDAGIDFSFKTIILIKDFILKNNIFIFIICVLLLAMYLIMRIHYIEIDKCNDFCRKAANCSYNIFSAIK